MIFFKYLLVVAISLATAHLALAAQEGHGGNGIVCFDSPSIPASIRKSKGEILDEYISHVTSVTALDLHVAQLSRGFEPKKPVIIGVNKNESIFQYIERLATRFEKYLPAVSMTLRQGNSYFSNPDKIHRLPNGLMKVEDTNSREQYDKRNCVLGTIIYQDSVSANGSIGNYLNIDERLFFHKNHTELSRAVLFTHEIVLTHAMELGHADTRNTLLLVGRLITRDADMTLLALSQEFRALNFLDLSPTYIHSLLYESYMQPYTVGIRAVRTFEEQKHPNLDKAALQEEKYKISTASAQDAYIKNWQGHVLTAPGFSKEFLEERNLMILEALTLHYDSRDLDEAWSKIDFIEHSLLKFSIP